MLNRKSTIALGTLVAVPAISLIAILVSTPAYSQGKCVQVQTRCPNGRWVTSSCNGTQTAEELCGIKSPSGSSSSSVPSGGSIGTVLGTAIGQEIGKALFGDPEADARRNAEQELERQRAAEQTRRQQEEQRNRLLGGMMGVDNSPQLGLMGIESSSGLSLMTDSPSANPARSSAFSKGYEHASQCFSQNSGSTCAGASADQQQTCVADYRGGYELGNKQKEVVLQEAYRTGQAAAARGELANGASDARALGPCRTDWIMAYNRGHFSAKSAPSVEASVDTRDPEVKRIINEMIALAKRLGWSPDQQASLASALNNLRSDGDQNVTDIQIRRAWQDVLVRDQDGNIARKAAQGDGPGLSGAGTQSFEDCAIFALANASGLPYSVVAARATKLISEGEWRDAAARANPQKAIEQKGLIGGEVVMLAATIGQVEVVPSTAFNKTLKEGRAVMVNVVPQNGDVRSGHQVVLTKTFQHDGETWYEMVDSNQGPQRRLYLSKKELDTLLQEKGVTFSPERGTDRHTPALVKSIGIDHFEIINKTNSYSIISLKGNSCETCACLLHNGLDIVRSKPEQSGILIKS